MKCCAQRCLRPVLRAVAAGHALIVLPLIAEAQITSPCTDGGAVRELAVSAIDVTLPLNRWGDHLRDSYMYALDANIPAIRAFEAELERDRERPETAGDPGAVARVSHGLGKDPIQPLVLRANRGECLRIRFTHRLGAGGPVALHIQGLPHTADNAGGAVGRNPDTFAAPGATVTYEIPIPDDPHFEGAYVFHDHGASRRRQQRGLFGALVVEPPGASYLDPETGEELDTLTGSNWEAIILDPEGPAFREIVLVYHQVEVLEIRDRHGKKVSIIDPLLGTFHPETNALNYRSEPFFRRAEIDEEAHGEERRHHVRALGRSSYAYGDPATPIPRAYLGETIRTRLVHGGTETFHVHHQHGGLRWLRSPGAATADDSGSGLVKVPSPALSARVDTQLLGPGASFTLEHECGAGGCQQAAGDFLFRSLIGHHELGGMWGFYRVFDTLQTADTNLHGRPLAVVPELYPSDNPFSDAEAPSNRPPETAVSAGELLGLVVDGGRRIVDDAQLTDPSTEVGLRAWIRGQLPPPGQRLDRFDATVWDWTFDGSGGSLRVLGEPEETRSFANYVSPAPGERPEVLFNPNNARYAWPLLRPHLGARPPFTARHSGAPWLGERMDQGRLDGLCAADGVHPEVVVSRTAVDRSYPMSAVATPIRMTADGTGGIDPEGRIFVLNEDVAALRAAARNGDLPGVPLAVRSALGDCVEVVLTNRIPDGPPNEDDSLAGLHSSLAQLDPQASDGTVVGFSYEQTVRPLASEDRALTAPAAAGATVIAVGHTERLRPGVWIGVGLGEGVCGAGAGGRPRPCTEVRQIAALDAASITLDQPLALDHGTGEAVGVEFVRYLWYADSELGTTILQPAVDFRNLDHGLFGVHVVEPAGATWHDPATGEELRSGLLADIRVRSGILSQPAEPALSFRELVLLVHSQGPAQESFSRPRSTLNLRAEPWSLREDPAYRFSSVRYGDPRTPILRAYAGEPVRIRAAGMLERYSGVRFTGHRFALEPRLAASPLVDVIPLGNGERFDVAFDGGAGGPARQAGDYLYYSVVGKDFEAGAWGLIRVHDKREGDLRPLPGRPAPPAGDGFPVLTFTGESPPSLPGRGHVCPPAAPRRVYSLVEMSGRVVYNDALRADRFGTVYRLQGRPAAAFRAPLVLRANAGDCLVLVVRNARDLRSGLHVGKLLFDPQRAYGAAIGFNYDSTLAPGRARRLELYADRELGTAVALDLADLEATRNGAFGAIVIEPEGARYLRPGLDAPLPAGGWGVEADIVTGTDVVREVVALFNDQDRRLGQNAKPHSTLPGGQSGISYSREPLELRGQRESPALVFSSRPWGDPRRVARVSSGQALVYRLAKPWGHQAQLPTLEGHRFAVAGGGRHGKALLPGEAHDLVFTGGAGSVIGAPGDYLFGDRRWPFLEAGSWQLLRVTD